VAREAAKAVEAACQLRLEPLGVRQPGQVGQPRQSAPERQRRGEGGEGGGRAARQAEVEQLVQLLNVPKLGQVGQPESGQAEAARSRARLRSHVLERSHVFELGEVEEPLDQGEVGQRRAARKGERRGEGAHRQPRHRRAEQVEVPQPVEAVHV